MKHTKLIALTLCAVLALTLAGCHTATPGVALTVDGEEIPSGLYLLYQLQAYNEAAGMVTDTKADVLKSEVEGKNGAEWIHAKTVDAARRYVALNKAFDAAGLALTDEEIAGAKTELSDNWATGGAYFEKNGIGLESYMLYYLNDLKYQKLYADYAEKNADSVTDEQAKKYMNDNFSHVEMVTLPTTDKDNKAVAAADAETIKGYADALQAKLAAGGTMQEDAPEYLKKAYELCGREYTEEIAAQAITTNFFSKDSTSYYAKTLVDEIMAGKVGDAGMYMTSTTPMVYQKIVNFKDDAEFANYRDSLANSILGEKLDAELVETGAAYTVDENAAAVKAYSAKNIKKAA